MTLCDTCSKANVSCPIYPQDTTSCVEYSEAKVKHTQGKWTIDKWHGVESGGIFKNNLAIMSGNFCVAMVQPGDADAQVNAKLIAAAPEMLELLKELDEDRPVVGGEYGPITCCPICLFPKAYGHFPDCKLGNLLACLNI